MTKPELVALIMDNTDEYRKTHLMDKPKAELEELAAGYIATEAVTPIDEPEAAGSAMTPGNTETPADTAEAAVGKP